jgi:hypothetical protein
MGVDNWFFGNAGSMPTKAEHHNDPSPLLCPEDRGALCDFPGIFCINLMHHNTPQMHYYSAQFISAPFQGQAQLQKALGLLSVP